jgi:uncharacterized protein
MKILISGSSGLIGTALIERLSRSGHQVMRLVRREPAPGEGGVFWDPYGRKIEASRIEGIDAVVHLAGKSIGAGRWTSSAKKEMVASRIIPTQFLTETISSLKTRPRLFLSASAVGYYGDRKDETLTEASQPGVGFLSDLCVAWERACEPAAAAGIRTVNLRIGLVLSADGGALPRMAAPFRLGVGGKLGSGRQYMSWITLDDLISVFEFVLADGSLWGSVNAVTPHPVPNVEFTKALARAVHRPALVAVPAFVLKLLLGEMGETLLLSSARVLPEKLERAGFSFQQPDLQPALQNLLSK